MAHESLNGSQIFWSVRVVGDDVGILVGRVPCPMMNTHKWEGLPVAIEELVTPRGCRPLATVDPGVHPAAHDNLTKSGGISVSMAPGAFWWNDKLQPSVPLVENLVVSAGGHHTRM